MSDDPFGTTDPFAETPRDRYGRPLVIPPDGGKPVAYTRCTTYVGCLEDTFNLAKWQQRMVAIGLAKRPDLLLSVSAHNSDSKTDKRILDDVCTDAREAAAASAAATTGTALHRIVERLDRGEPVEVPAAAQADVAAYTEQTKVMRHRYIERLMVCDELKIAGTPDRVSTFMSRLQIADLKTGSIEWGMGKIAMQLAVYAHSDLYDPQTGERTALRGLDQRHAIVIHLPAGTGTCTLHSVDIKAGWDAVQLARDVRAWRARKNLAEPITYHLPDLAALISKAASVAQLTALWQEHSSRWTDEHTALASARKAALLEQPSDAA